MGRVEIKEEAVVLEDVAGRKKGNVDKQILECSFNSI
jgi:hypothetical protein